MLIEIWEHLRGYDKWVETQAKIESSNVEKTPIADRSGAVVNYAYASGDTLSWTDHRGEKQYADFTVPDDSPLYQMIGGETVTIRYDPAHPDRFYYRDLLRTRIHTAVKTTIITIILLGVLLMRFAPAIARLRR